MVVLSCEMLESVIENWITYVLWKVHPQVRWDAPALGGPPTKHGRGTTAFFAVLTYLFSSRMSVYAVWVETMPVLSAPVPTGTACQESGIKQTFD